MVSRKSRRWLLIIAVLILATLIIAPTTGHRLSAQTLDFTPTYQVSISQYANFLPGSEFQALGVMLGFQRSRGPWVPHLWVQRYENRLYGRGMVPEGEDASMTRGWIVSLGPAIRFLDTGPFSGVILPEVILGAPGGGTRGVDSGVGVHMGLEAGFFVPQAFSRVQTHGNGWFWSLGVGATFQVVWDHDWDRGSPW